MKRFIYFALSAAIATIFLSACGKDDNDIENSQENPSDVCDNYDNESEPNSSDLTYTDFEYLILTDSTVAIQGFNIVSKDMIIPDKVKIKGKTYTVTECDGSRKYLQGVNTIEIPQTVTKICSLSAEKIILHKSQEDLLNKKDLVFNNVGGNIYFTDGYTGYCSLDLEDGKMYTASNDLKNFSFIFSTYSYRDDNYQYIRKIKIKIDGYDEFEYSPNLDRRMPKYLRWVDNKFLLDNPLDSISDKEIAEGAIIDTKNYDTNVVAIFGDSHVNSPCYYYYTGGIITGFNIK